MAIFQDAVVADPAFPWRWSDLGDALLASGQRKEAAECFHESLVLGPALPQIALRAVNFHFQTGEIQPALELGAAFSKNCPILTR